MKALSYSYIHRKEKKRNFRGLWIQRLSCAAKIEGLSYSKLIYGLSLSGCQLNRKMLSELAISDPEGFHLVAESAKKALAKV
jgi:large subunit ribosomal protein L20